MKISHYIICQCHRCDINLSYLPYYQNIFNGGSWYCSNCGANVTEDIYGKKKADPIQPEDKGMKLSV